MALLFYIGLHHPADAKYVPRACISINPHPPPQADPGRGTLDTGTTPMSVRILHADVLDGLALLPSESVHCAVTSPPFWSLRDYDTAFWQGGEAGCAHEVIEADRTLWANVMPGPNGRRKDSVASRGRPRLVGGHCRKCGAQRHDRQIGLEATPGDYVARIVEVMRAVRRVLRKDGTLWLNLGDSFAGSWGAQGRRTVPATISRDSIINQPKRAMRSAAFRADGLKPKDLIGIPWRVALALQADGWWLRSEIIWAKPNSRPESVSDRPLLTRRSSCSPGAGVISTMPRPCASRTPAPIMPAMF